MDHRNAPWLVDAIEALIVAAVRCERKIPPAKVDQERLAAARSELVSRLYRIFGDAK